MGRTCVNSRRIGMIIVRVLPLAGLAMATPATAQEQSYNPTMLRRSPVDPNILDSQAYHRMWYVKGISLGGRTLADLETMCRAVRTKGGTPWHAPSYTDLQTLSYRLYPQQFDPTRKFYDAPDRRNFGRLVGRAPGFVMFPATDFTPYAGQFTYRVMKAWGNGTVSFDLNFASSRGSVRFEPANILICVSGYR